MHLRTLKTLKCKMGLICSFSFGQFIEWKWINKAKTLYFIVYDCYYNIKWVQTFGQKMNKKALFLFKIRLQMYYSTGNWNVPLKVSPSFKLNMFVEMVSPMCAVKVGQIWRVIEVWDNHFSFPFKCRTEGGHMINHTNKSILSSVPPKYCGHFSLSWILQLNYSLFMIITDRRNSRQWLIFICIWWTDDRNIWWCIYLKTAL